MTEIFKHFNTHQNPLQTQNNIPQKVLWHQLMGACAAKAAQIKDQHDPSDNIPKKKKKKLTRAQIEVDAVLNHLAVPTMAVKKFLTFFKKMDDDSSGSISLEEFIVFLKVSEPSKRALSP